jgi:hypothetical protein
MLFLLPPRLCRGEREGNKKSPPGLGGLDVVPYAGIIRIRFLGFYLRSRGTFHTNTPLFMYSTRNIWIYGSAVKGFF